MTHEEFEKRYTYNPSTDQLGEGGFGEVFKAYDTHRDRWVAIKMSKVIPEYETVRLKKEVEMVNNLPTHPNIAYYEECYTFRSFAGEYDFGILQYYEAGNLQQLTQRVTLSQAQKEDILKQLLDGIGFLHSQGIIHRDLKPQNILIVNRNGAYIPKITDFGISKKLDINKSSLFSNSIAGAGTLSYASPEQLGDRTISKNTDLWSYGVIAFWLFTGELPFNTGQLTSTSEAGRSELFRQIKEGVLPTSIEKISPLWRMLIEGCLKTGTESRIKNTEQCFDILNTQNLAFTASSPTSVNPETKIRPANQSQKEETEVFLAQPILIEEAIEEAETKKHFIPWILASLVIIGIIIAFAWPKNSSTKQITENIISDQITIQDSLTDLSNSESLPSGNAQLPINNKSGSNKTIANESKSQTEELFTNPPIYTIVEEMPTYKGGDVARMKFLQDNIKYPQMARESGIQGAVYVNFIVDTKGNVTEVKVLRGIGGGCDDEAVRVVKMMPKWQPGKQSGKTVRVLFNMPIYFRLSD